MRIADVEIICFSCVHRRMNAIINSQNLEEATAFAVDNRCEYQYHDFPFGKLYSRCPDYEPVCSGGDTMT